MAECLPVEPGCERLNIRFRLKHRFGVFERFIKCERCQKELAVEANGRLGEAMDPEK